ncbi:MAG: RtcB family protein [Candidatus Omnitrophota bacterium]
MSKGASCVLEQIDEFRWRVPQTYKPGMRVEGRIVTDARQLELLLKDQAVEQVANAAFLPGIVKYSLAMPDIHWGYGLPIGGVVATDVAAGGVITPGGVGFDINCGVRLLRTALEFEEIQDKIDELTCALYKAVPAGVGSKGFLRLTEQDERKLLVKGALWAVEAGFGTREDLEFTEEHGQMQNADPDAVFKHAYERGRLQSGTLGSGNHFLEIQKIDAIFDEKAAQTLGLHKGQVTIMIHTGSRGFGHQVCTDYVKIMLECLRKYDIHVPDRQLACAPATSVEGQAYLGAMRCAANYAWCNRQILTYLTRQVFEKFFASSWERLGMQVVYDVAHNIAKIEQHAVAGRQRTLCVHRKGATRAFGPGHIAVPLLYRELGQPVIIPGDMGRNSYLLAGTEQAMEESFGSTCHGAGRLKSRSQALRTLNQQTVLNDLRQKGICVRAATKGTICEEAPEAYKNVNDVVDIVHSAGISRKICRMRPLGVLKG